MNRNFNIENSRLVYNLFKQIILNQNLTQKELTNHLNLNSGTIYECLCCLIENKLIVKKRFENTNLLIPKIKEIEKFTGFKLNKENLGSIYLPAENFGQIMFLRNFLRKNKNNLL